MSPNAKCCAVLRHPVTSSSELHSFVVICLVDALTGLRRAACVVVHLHLCSGGLLHRGRADQPGLHQQQLLALQQQQMAAQQLQQQLASQQLLAEQQRQQQQQPPQQRRSQEGGPVPVPISLTMPSAAAGGEAITFEDLEMRRVIGTGQFGLVRVVRHVPTNAVYALKVRRQSLSLSHTHSLSLFPSHTHIHVHTRHTNRQRSTSPGSSVCIAVDAVCVMLRRSCTRRRSLRPSRSSTWPTSALSLERCHTPSWSGLWAPIRTPPACTSCRCVWGGGCSSRHGMGWG